jgi:hypothetical protein
VAEGCKDIDRMPVAMEHPTVARQEACPGPAGSQQWCYTLHPVVPNPYTLLRLLPSQASWFTCLDLKDAFFCLCLALISQPLFTFEWEDPHTGRKTQMTWASVPQGFQNSPTLFREALAVDFPVFLEENASCTLP